MYVAWRSLILRASFGSVPPLYFKWIFSGAPGLGRCNRSEVADVGGQAHPGPKSYGFVVSDDPLDVQRRREFVEARDVVDHLDAFSSHEP